MPGKKKDYSLGKKSKGDLIDLELPSGNFVQVKRPGVDGLIKAGLLDNFDQLTALVQTEHIEANSVRGKVTPDQAKAAGAAMMADKEKLATVIWMMDGISHYVIVQPATWIDYKVKDASQEDGLETDASFEKRAAEAEEKDLFPIREVDMDDKMFLLNWAVGGSSNLEEFRQGTQKLMDNVASVEEVQLPA